MHNKTAKEEWARAIQAVLAYGKTREKEKDVRKHSPRPFDPPPDLPSVAIEPNETEAYPPM